MNTPYIQWWCVVYLASLVSFWRYNPVVEWNHMDFRHGYWKLRSYTDMASLICIGGQVHVEQIENEAENSRSKS